MPPIVPGGFGFGMQTRGGYGGSSTPAICIVDNNNPSGSGSLKDALELDQPRLVFLCCSGDIDLNDTIRITSPYCSLWGATAPSPGINIRKYGIECLTHDVMLSHIRIRPGEYGQGKEDNCGFIAYAQTADLVLDHISIAHGPDENFAFSTYTGQDMRATMWRCLSAECLDKPASSPDSESHGILVQAGSRKVLICQSYCGTNRERNPYAQANCEIVTLNNLIYNWFALWANAFTNATFAGVGAGHGPAWSATVIGNAYKIGLNTDDDPGTPAIIFYYGGLVDFGLADGNRIYKSDNIVYNPFGLPLEYEVSQLPYDPNVDSPPVPIAGFTIMSSADVEAHVLANVGARPLDRDTIDTRIMSDYAGNIARGYRNHQNLFGTQPDLAVNCITLPVPSNPHQVQPSGYTIIEEWAHTYNEAVEGAGATVTPGTDVGGTTDPGTGVPYPPSGGSVIVVSKVCCEDPDAPVQNWPGDVLPPVGTAWTSTCEGGGTPPTAADLTPGESWDA